MTSGQRFAQYPDKHSHGMSLRRKVRLYRLAVAFPRPRPVVDTPRGGDVAFGKIGTQLDRISDSV